MNPAGPIPVLARRFARFPVIPWSGRGPGTREQRGPEKLWSNRGNWSSIMGTGVA
jgi:hypothetical protein